MKSRVEDLLITQEPTFKKFQERVCVPPSQDKIDELFNKSWDSSNITWNQFEKQNFRSGKRIDFKQQL
jgi:hypothetical protein